MNKVAIIVAGGTGTRMGSSIPKQFMLLNDKPILYYSIKAFLEADDEMKVIVVLPVEYFDMGMEVMDAYFDKNRIQLVEGGPTRFHSVKNGLQLVEDESIILVHDGVRCLIKPALINECIAVAEKTGTAIPVLPSKDSVRILDGELNNSMERNRVMLVQTPQAFHSKVLLPAYEIEHKEKFTDEASVVDAFGIKLTLVRGDEHNIKITTPLDLSLASFLLNN